ncbi:SDR family oxidoreductase [Mucilaginibacter agri]|uniref:SDR family oxidoreductase n=1 Tax=Mucilaginibacter agri TaxID=2695265 RepID=A0A965ZLC2_9SPHI|nr:SDR family oxidoreductase [Mucilaginibacter agri]NCD71706.1 SDR family oxidoreductase [Mucilaginibacter agri]
MNLNIEGKVIIVTGGAQGIGKGIVMLLANEGAIPVIVSRTEATNKETMAEVEALGGQAFQIPADLTDPLQCESAVQKVIAQFGRIDGLINNAGENDGVGLESGNYEKFMRSLHKNVIHYYLMAHYALPELKKTQGAIVNITSKVGETGQGGTSGYAASNGARNTLTREWAVELLPWNIRVNAVSVAECWTPLYERWIDTFENKEEKLADIQKNIPLGQRMTTAEEIANTVVFLLSPVSSHTTGQIIFVDGGYVHLDRALDNTRKES